MWWSLPTATPSPPPLESRQRLPASPSGPRGTGSPERRSTGTTSWRSTRRPGALLIGPSGIAAKLSLGASFNGPGFVLSGGLEFELNTTGSAIGSIAGQVVNLPGGAFYVRIAVAGRLELLGLDFLEIRGSLVATDEEVCCFHLVQKTISI